MKALRAKGYDVTGHDPVYAPGKPRKADVVLLVYILNVLTSPCEREHVFKQAWKHARKRLTIALELVAGPSVLFLDEPTTGLHFEDIRHLLAVLQALVRKGNTVLVIEHNLDLIAQADWVVDLGPEGGEGGGRILGSGTPEELAAQDTPTGEALRAGIPQLVVPWSQDQPDNAARVRRLGVARVLPRNRFDAAAAERAQFRTRRQAGGRLVLV